MTQALRAWATASWARLLLAALPLATGAALVIHIVASFSLALAVAVLVAFTVAVAAIVWRQLSAARRLEMQHRVLVGVFAGVLATAAYDLSRLVLVTLVPMAIWPFTALPLFGQALSGDGGGTALDVGLGLLYHLANGIGFATAFVIVVPRPRVIFGIAWAMVLELLMVSLYPGWLNLKALDEFMSVSIVGHLSYGATLGGVAAWGVGRARLFAGQPIGRSRP